ncbi:sensor domain-containing diguanylate cyclase [Deinococcus cellulosilyticus]|nr:PAS domain S-box protein [Deinococcus cellulosilyticus]
MTRSKNNLMSSPSQGSSLQRARFLAGLTLILSLLFLLGWWTGGLIAVLLPLGLVINPVTAVALMLLALALYLQTVQQERASLWLCGAVAVFAVFRLLTFQLPAFQSMEQWLFREHLAGLNLRFPAQIPVSALVGLFLLSLSLIAVVYRHRRSSQLMVVITFLTAVWTIQGYLLGILDRDPSSLLYPMSLSAALAVVLLGTGITYLQHLRGMGNIQFEPHAGGLLTRWLFPAVLVLPPLLTFLVMKGVRSGGLLWDQGMGWLSFGTTLGLMGFTYVLALSVKRADLEHQQFLSHLKSSEEKYRAVTELAADAIITTDGEGSIINFNQSAQQLFRYTEEEVLGRDFTFLLPEPYRNTYQQNLKQYMQEEVLDLLDKRVEIEGQTREGRVFPLELSVSVWEVAGERFFTGFIRDISKRVQLEEQQKRLVALLSQSRDAIVSTDLTGKVLFWNPAAEELFGFRTDEVTGQNIDQLFPEHRLREEIHILRALERGETTENLETERLHKDGHLLYVSVSISPVLNAAGEVIGATSIARDIGEARAIRQQLAHALSYSQTQTEVYRILDQPASAQEAARDITLLISQVMELDFGCLVRPGSQAMEVSPIWEATPGVLSSTILELFQQDLNGWLEQTFRQNEPLYVDDVQEALISALDCVPAGTTAAFVPLIPAGPGGNVALVFVGCRLHAHMPWSREDRNLFESAARSVRVALERQERLKRMEEAALTDALTGLGNRRAFQDDLESLMASARRHHHPLCVVQMDLDGLKKINDRWGHEEGDRLLDEFARQLKESMRAEDRCYRLGGDEFAMILSHSPLGSQDAILERLQTVMDAVRAQGFADANVSAGVAYFPEEAVSSRDLLRLADGRMYHMKDQHHQSRGEDSSFENL